MSNNYIKHLLTEDEKKLLFTELTKDHIHSVLYEFQNKFNDIFKTFISIFRKIFYFKKTTKQLEETSSLIDKDLIKIEQTLLNKYKILLLYIKLSKLDFKNSDIYLEFSGKEEENEFFQKLKDKKYNLDQFKKQIDELESIQNRINSLYDKAISYNCLDFQK